MYLNYSRLYNNVCIVVILSKLYIYNIYIYIYIYILYVLYTELPYRVVDIEDYKLL